MAEITQQKQSTLNLYYGPAMDPISRQIKEQGFVDLPEEMLKRFDKLKEAHNFITFCILPPESFREQLVKRINKHVVDSIQEFYNKQAKENK